MTKIEEEMKICDWLIGHGYCIEDASYISELIVYHGVPLVRAIKDLEIVSSLSNSNYDSNLNLQERDSTMYC